MLLVSALSGIMVRSHDVSIRVCSLPPSCVDFIPRTSCLSKSTSRFRCFFSQHIRRAVWEESNGVSSSFSLRLNLSQASSEYFLAIIRDFRRVTQYSSTMKSILLFLALCSAVMALPAETPGNEVIAPLVKLRGLCPGTGCAGYDCLCRNLNGDA